jgi:hypothetical protein
MKELLTGYLKKLNDGSFVVRTVTTLGSLIPKFEEIRLHPSHDNDENLIHGKEIEFVVETIAIGQNEFDVLDCDVAKIINYDYHSVVTKGSNFLLDSIVENYPDEEILKADGLDDAIIGIDEGSLRLIYSKAKCIEIFVNEGMDEEDALDHYYYNVVGSYVGEKTPIWCEDTLL